MKYSNDIKTLIKNYIPSLIISTILFIVSFIIICSFYSIEYGKIEIPYPIMLLITLWIIYVCVDFTRFAKYNRKMYKYFDETLSSKYRREIISLSNEKRDESRFISAWIHNMKTPLTVSKLVISRLAMKQIEVDEAAKQLEADSKQLISSLDTVLDMLRVKEFEKDYVPSPINIYDEIKEIINLNKKRFIYSEVYPTLQCVDEKLMVLTDKKWNRAMIGQIINNAIKYTEIKECDNKRVDFTITVENDGVKLTIADNGIGIEKADLIRVFEPFFTGENGRKGVSSSGIGLYFCKEVSDMLGTNISIDSKIGEGTSITLKYIVDGEGIR